MYITIIYDLASIFNDNTKDCNMPNGFRNTNKIFLFSTKVDKMFEPFVL